MFGGFALVLKRQQQFGFSQGASVAWGTPSGRTVAAEQAALFCCFDEFGVCRCTLPTKAAGQKQLRRCMEFLQHDLGCGLVKRPVSKYIEGDAETVPDVGVFSRKQV